MSKLVKPNCFEKTKVRWGIFKKLSTTKLHSEQSAPLAANVLQLNADFVLHKICDLGAVMYQFIFYFFALAFN